MPDCWLEFSLHPEGSATGQLDQGFPIFLGPRVNAEFVPKFHVALHASHAALQMVALEISHCTNVTSKYGDLALQVGGVSDETVKYGLSSAGLRPKSDCSGKAQEQLYSNFQTCPLVREGTTKLQTRNCLNDLLSVVN
jgi:hypothetical protein